MIQDDILNIIKPHLSGDNSISMELIERIFADRDDFDMEQYGVNSMCEFFQAMGGIFSVSEDEQTLSVKMIEEENVKTNESINESSIGNAEENKPDVVEIDPNHPIFEQITGILKRLGGETDYIAETHLGQEMSKNNIKKPNGWKLGAMLKANPQKFERVDSGNANWVVKLVKQDRTKSSNKRNSEFEINKKTDSESGLRGVSKYSLKGFCQFPNWKETLKRISEIAVQDGWIVLDDPYEVDPYRLIGNRLHTDFALAIKDDIDGKESDLKIWPTRAKFKTSFRTSKGESVYLTMLFNHNRDANSTCPWILESLVCE